MNYKRYIDFLHNTYNGLSGREDLEWSNCWIDSANKESDKRYLLIGDSTIRMIRSTFAKMCNSPVDMIGTSSRLDDVLFANLIDYFFESSIYKYDAIFVQLGHHVRIGKDGGLYSENDLNEFGQNFVCLISYLKQFCDKIIVESIFDSVVAFRKNTLIKELIRLNLYQKLYTMGIKTEKYDSSINIITHAKSERVHEIAKTLEVTFADVNEFMKHTNFIHIDHIHYENRAKVAIAEFMMNYIK